MRSALIVVALAALFPCSAHGPLGLELVVRLPAAGLLPSDEVARRLADQMRRGG